MFMIEEMFKRDPDLDDDGTIAGLEHTMSFDEEEQKQKEKLQFKKEDRVKAFNDLVFINKYARNTPPTSQLRLLTAQKIPFIGPDPPIEPPEKTEEELEAERLAEEARKAEKAKGKGNKNQQEEEKPQELPKTAEELAELEIIIEFSRKFREEVERAERDLGEYRALCDPFFGVDKVPLWPKVMTKEEI